VTQVDLQPPATDDHWSGWSPPTERFVRRRRRILILAIVLVVVVSGSWLYSYNPFQQSLNGPFFTGLTAESGSKIHTVDVFAPTNSALGHEYTHSNVSPVRPRAIIWIEPEGRYTINFEATITNRSPVSIAIESIGAPLVNQRGDHFRAYFYNRYVKSGEGKPFHHFALGAHDRISVVVTFTQACVPSATTTSSGEVTAMPVRYSMFGLSHSTTVPILPFGVQSRKSC
jgi:hypothetical protein